MNPDDLVKPICMESEHSLTMVLFGLVINP